MSPTQIAQIKSMADRLIETLSSFTPTEKADAIVMDVANELYHDILGIEGEIVMKNKSIVHGGFGKNGRKTASIMADYKFEPREESQT